jgi:hypothetical protein
MSRRPERFGAISAKLGLVLCSLCVCVRACAISLRRPPSTPLRLNERLRPKLDRLKNNGPFSRPLLIHSIAQRLIGAPADGSSGCETMQPKNVRIRILSARLENVSAAAAGSVDERRRIGATREGLRCESAPPWPFADRLHSWPRRLVSSRTCCMSDRHPAGRPLKQIALKRPAAIRAHRWASGRPADRAMHEGVESGRRRGRCLRRKDACNESTAAVASAANVGPTQRPPLIRASARRQSRITFKSIKSRSISLMGGTAAVVSSERLAGLASCVALARTPLELIVGAAKSNGGQLAPGNIFY